MTTNDVSGVLRETLGRTSATVAASRASIERSDDRVRDTLDILTRSQGGFDLAGAGVSDDELAQDADRRQATSEQREIERQMLRSARDGVGDGPGD